MLFRKAFQRRLHVYYRYYSVANTNYYIRYYQPYGLSVCISRRNRKYYFKYAPRYNHLSYDNISVARLFIIMPVEGRPYSEDFAGTVHKLKKIILHRVRC